VAGTAAVKDGNIIHHGDVYAQTKTIYYVTDTAITALGGPLRDVIRTGICVKNINDWEAIVRAHEEVFSTIRLVTSMIEVSAFIDTAIVVEIKLDTWLG